MACDGSPTAAAAASAAAITAAAAPISPRGLYAPFTHPSPSPPLPAASGPSHPRARPDGPHQVSGQLRPRAQHRVRRLMLAYWSLLLARLLSVAWEVWLRMVPVYRGAVGVA